MHHRSMLVRANGLEHHVLEWCPARPVGAPLVLVHGFMDSARSFSALAQRLAAAGVRVFAPDLRGFGETERVGAGGYYHFPDYVLDLAELVDDLIPTGPLSLVGHSMGGTVATLYAGSVGARVERLVTMEGMGPPSSDFAEAPDRMRAWIDGVRRLRAGARAGEGDRSMTREDAVARIQVSHPTLEGEALARALDALAVEEDGAFRWRFDPLHRTRSPSPFYAPQLCAFAARVTCPVLHVSGGPLGYHPPDEAERLAAFADLRSLELPGAGHMMHWTQPDALAEGLLDFLGRGAA